MRARISAALAIGAVAVACSDEPKNVEPPARAKIVAFRADAAEVARGRTVELAWTVENATLISIEATPGGPLVTDDARATGAVTSAPLESPTTFILTARGEGAPATASVVVGIELPVTIESFAVSPGSIARGQSASLSWRVKNALSVKIDVLDGPNLLPEGDRFEGTRTVMPDETTTYVLVATGKHATTEMKSVTVRVNAPGDPMIVSFLAEPMVITRGETSVLRWEAQNASTVTITDRSGGVIYGGRELSGTRPVMPAASERYVMVAAGMTRNATRTLDLTVNPPVGARILELSATPMTIDLGDSSTIAWRVEQAPGGVELFEAGRRVLTSTLSSGARVVTPTTSTDYSLIARNPQGDSSAMVRVQVNPALARILELSASPNPGPLGGLAAVRWRARNADRVRLFAGLDLVVDRTSSTAQGVVQVALTSTRAAITLEAVNAIGTASQRLVLSAVAPPRIDRFEVGPLDFAGAAATASIGWSTSDATAVRLLADGAPVAAFPGTAAGSFSTQVSGTTELELVAENAAGAVRARKVIAQRLAEIEPNDSAQTATPVPSGVVEAAIDADGEEDWLRVSVPAGGSVEASFRPVPSCEGLSIELAGAAGATLGASAEAPGRCAEIDPGVDAFARDLTAGDYLLVVRRAPGSSGPYALQIMVREPGCGNGLIEERGPAIESCDDGNTLGGDGCSATCSFEGALESEPNDDAASATVLLGRFPIVAGAIDPAGEDDWYRVEVPAGHHVEASLAVESFDRCPADPSGRLELIAPDGRTVLAANAYGGRDRNCGRISPAVAAGARSLAGGSYWIRVHENGDDAAIGRYFLTVRVIPPGCGNRVREGLEQCDDGGREAGDGCSAACGFEPRAQIVIPGATVTRTSGLRTAGAQDAYLVQVTERAVLFAEATVPGVAAGCAGGDLVMTLLAADGVTAIGTDDDSGPGQCPAFDPAFDSYARLEPGTYWIRVEEFLNDRAVPIYDFRAGGERADTCGNGAPEPSLGEECDDRNLSAGDGCDASCRYEIAAELDPPGGSVTLDLATPAAYRLVRVNVTTPGQSITATAADAGGGCTVDTFVNFGGPTFQILGRDDYDGPGQCAAIDPARDAWARDLAPGRYHIAVLQEGAALGPTELSVGVRDPACGNRLIENRAGEECDDGGTAAGDGCSPACVAESVVMAPGPAVRIPGSITFPTERDVVRVVASAPVYLRAVTWAPDTASMSCTGADTVVRIVRADRQTVVGFDNDDGEDLCSRIDPARGDDFSRVNAGTYYVTVEEAGNDALIAAYELELEGVPVDVCGNGVIERARGERCDDGGLAAGDDCDASCQPENLEVEPNDSGASANASGLAGVGVVHRSGAIGPRGGPTGDRDAFWFEVPAGPSLVLDAVTYGVPGHVDQCGAIDTTIALEDGAGQVLESNDDGASACASITGRALSPGRYVVRVGSYRDPIAAYWLELRLRP